MDAKNKELPPTTPVFHVVRFVYGFVVAGHRAFRRSLYICYGIISVSYFLSWTGITSLLQTFGRGLCWPFSWASTLCDFTFSAFPLGDRGGLRFFKYFLLWHSLVIFSLFPFKLVFNCKINLKQHVFSHLSGMTSAKVFLHLRVYRDCNIRLIMKNKPYWYVFI